MQCCTPRFRAHFDTETREPSARRIESEKTFPPRPSAGEEMPAILASAAKTARRRVSGSLAGLTAPVLEKMQMESKDLIGIAHLPPRPHERRANASTANRQSS